MRLFSSQGELLQLLYFLLHLASAGGRLSAGLVDAVYGLGYLLQARPIAAGRTRMTCTYR